MPRDRREYNKEWRNKNKEKVSANKKAYVKRATKEQIARWRLSSDNYAKNNPERRILSIIKYRAKQKNMEFNLEPEDIKIPETCPIFNYPLIKQLDNKGKFGPRYNSPSVDRIDNTKGYVKGNIQIISNKANSMKSSATPEELLQFAYWVLLTYGHLIDKEIS
jgi:hypothetical protein